MRFVVLILATLSLLGCRNETNDRLARIEKKLDQIQQNPAGETIVVPSQTNPVLTTASGTPPPNVAPAEPAAFVNPPLSQRQIQISAGVAELGVRRGQAAYVARDGNPQFGVVYQDVDKRAVLYKWNRDLKSYVSVCEVDPVLDHERLVDISPERMAKLQSQLSFVFDPPPLPPFTREDLANIPPPPSVHPDLAHTALDADVVELCVRDGRCAYVPTQDDPKRGVVYQDSSGTILCRWDAQHKYFQGIANVDFIKARDGKITLSEERLEYLRGRLAVP